MPGMQVLDVIIGLVFMYLLLGIIASALWEIWTNFRNTRAKKLEVGIKNLLGTKLTKTFYSHEMIRPLVYPEGKIKQLILTRKKTNGTKNNKTTDSDNKEESKVNSNMPSHISPEIFSMTLLDMLDYKDNPKDETDNETPLSKSFKAKIEDESDEDGKKEWENLKKRLVPFVTGHCKTRKSLSERIEVWFDLYMERVTSWYNKSSKIWVGIIGFLLVFAMNADTIYVADRLWNNAAIRQDVVLAGKLYNEKNNKPKDTKGKNTTNKSKPATKQKPATESGDSPTPTDTLTPKPPPTTKPVPTAKPTPTPPPTTKPVPNTKPTPKPSPKKKPAPTPDKDENKETGAMRELQKFPIGWCSIADMKETTEKKALPYNLVSFCLDKNPEDEKWVNKLLGEINSWCSNDKLDEVEKSKALIKILKAGCPKNEEHASKCCFRDWWNNSTPLDKLIKFLGLFITALGVSLGANFWFDALGKLLSLRAGGEQKKAKPKKKTNE